MAARRPPQARATRHSGSTSSTEAAHDTSRPAMIPSRPMARKGQISAVYSGGQNESLRSNCVI